jgi:hypothetical protein
MPQRRALDEAQRESLWSMYLAREPQSTIAKRFGISRQTVCNTIARIKRELAEGHHAELEEARAESLQVYKMVQERAWQRLVKCQATSTASVGYMSTIVTAQRRMDALLGLDEVTVNHRGIVWAQIEHAMTLPTPIDAEGALSRRRENRALEG